MVSRGVLGVGDRYGDREGEDVFEHRHTRPTCLKCAREPALMGPTGIVRLEMAHQGMGVVALSGGRYFVCLRNTELAYEVNYCCCRFSSSSMEHSIGCRDVEAFEWLVIYSVWFRSL